MNENPLPCLRERTTSRGSLADVIAVKVTVVRGEGGGKGCGLAGGWGEGVV